MVRCEFINVTIYIIIGTCTCTTWSAFHYSDLVNMENIPKLLFHIKFNCTRLCNKTDFGRNETL